MNKHAGFEEPLDDLEDILRDERLRAIRWREARVQVSRLTQYRRLKSRFGLFSAGLTGITRPAGVVPSDSAPRFSSTSLPRLRFIPKLMKRAAVFMAILALFGTVRIAAPEESEQVLAALVRNLPIYQSEVDNARLALDCAQHKLLFDAEGVHLAILAPRTPACQSRVAAIKSTAVPLKSARHIFVALESLEGKSQGWRSILGVIDIPAGAKRFFEYATGKRERLTGTPPILSAIEVITGRHQAMGVREKLRSIIIGARVVAIDMPRFDDRAVFMAKSLVCIRCTSEGGFSSAPLAGGICTRMLFGKDPAEPLSLGERCLLAASFRSQIRVAVPGASAAAMARMYRSLEEARERTPLCIDRLARSKEEASDAREFIDAYQLPGNLAVPRISKLAPGFAKPMFDLTKSRSGDLDNSDTLATTIRSEDQQSLNKRLFRDLISLDPLLPVGLCFRHTCPGEVPDVALVIAEIDGENLPVRLAWSNRHLLVAGETPPRALGSVSKVPIVLEIARSRVTELCNRSFGDVHNSDGPAGVPDCRNGAGLETPEYSVGRSRNLPILDFTRQRATPIRQLLAGLGWSDNSTDDDELALGTTLGYGSTASIAKHMQLMAAIFRARLNQAPAVRPLSPTETPAQDAALDLEALGYLRKDVTLAAGYLAFPLKPGGTLASLTPILHKRGCAQTTPIGKTGSAETSNQTNGRGVSAKTVLAAFQCGDRSFVAMVVIASPGGRDMDIGAVRALHLARIIDGGLQVLLKN
ncbi:MAG: hypothetical protein KUG69_10340 [Marinosulfonomonas sp.]|nr:hypothetical protein [Marinosulfonomonas sp.]